MERSSLGEPSQSNALATLYCWLTLRPSCGSGQYVRKLYQLFSTDAKQRSWLRSRASFQTVHRENLSNCKDSVQLKERRKELTHVKNRKRIVK